MSLSFAGLTLYAVLSGIEEDLRELIRVHVAPQKDDAEVLGDDLWKKCVGRLEWDLGFTAEKVRLIDLLIYLDFADAYQILNANRKLLPEPIAASVRKATPLLADLVPIRNRVAHTRPLNFEDYPRTMEVAQALIKGVDGIWDNLKNNLQRLDREPSFVLVLEIPTYERDAKDRRHNIPIPDFNDTGFLGRDKQIEEVVKRCLSPQYPVITIVGEGGIGKTALAQKVAYNILEQSDCPYDAVVWTSSKTTQITAKEIKTLKGAISTSLGMLQDVSDSLAPKSTETPIQEIHDYLGTFPILLILDNLETVLDERMTKFLTDIPNGSKVLITSRIGLGNAEFRIKLEPMNDQETLLLLRRVAEIQGVSQIVKAENRKLIKYCNKMSNNPGFVKWFVSAVATGSRPEEILQNSHIFYDFCMSNIYNYLNNTSRDVLKSMQYLQGRHSQAKLAYMNEMEASDLEKAIHELLRTNMVAMTSVLRGASYESQYELSELAFGYLQKHHPLEPNGIKKLEKLRRQLAAVAEQVMGSKNLNPYSLFSIVPRSSDDAILVKYLRDALNEAHNENFAIAKNLIAKARRLAPEYYEVHRVDAYLQEAQGNIPAARDAYEGAIDLVPQYAPLRFWYGNFLSKHLDDTEGALKQFSEASAIDPKSGIVKLSLARTHLYLHNFDEAGDLINLLHSQVIENTSPEWFRRKLYDVNLQFIQRKADYLCAQDERFDAVECLQNLKKEYQQCPPMLLDARMKETLRNAVRTANSCAYSIQDKVLKARVKRLAAWFSDNAE